MEVQGSFLVAVTLHTQTSGSLPFRILGLCARHYASLPTYEFTHVLRYSPITPISLLSDAIHHRSGFSPRPPHPTYLGTYVLLLCHHSSYPCLLWAFHLHSLSSNTYFWSTDKYTTCTHNINIFISIYWISIAKLISIYLKTYKIKSYK